ncbi:glycosyltransferase [Dubosiella newyorkensis]|uniref:Glycosyltransferase 2-like domain-containing protein n=1 Tax=Dubosiella newyorkensis TaxID=1862672 RepID=A0A1U7NKN4_9FIRM|nr:glycosyltransferase [Dubosiella newyorkensis]OLU44772.1 hypothetical protein BO225_09850 [Dubosiella newyorkensis]
MKKIIILLSTFNGSKFLKSQLDSINNQDAQNLEIEIIVRDDGSFDDTLFILNKKYDNFKLHIIKGEKNLGVCASFLELISNAPEADYYAFVDQDDIWDKYKLSTAIKALDHNVTGKPTLWASNCRIINENNEVIQQKLQKSNPIFTIPSQLICGSIQGCSMVFNKELFSIIRNSNFNYIPMHDILVTILALSNGEIIYNTNPIFSYRVHRNNVVAKNGKNRLLRMKQSISLWFGEKNKYSTSKFAAEILRHCNNLDKKDEDYLNDIIKSHKSLIAKMNIIKDSRTVSNNKRALISYKIRVLMGII